MKRFWKKIAKGLLVFTAVITVAILGIYTAAWFAMTKRTQAYIDSVWKDKNFTIQGEKPSLTGYPLEPRATFSGTFEHKSGFKIVTPRLNYAGFSAPHQLQYIEAPEGIFITAPFLDQNLKIDFMAIQIRVPRSFPASTHKDDISAWQKNGDPFVIPKIVLNTGKISAVGSGTLSLDDDLQIKGEIEARVIGMDAFLDDIATEQGEKSVAMAKSFLNMLMTTDEVTGEKYFQSTIRIQDRGLFFGPLRLTTLPYVTWSTAQQSPQSLPPAPAP